MLILQHFPTYRESDERCIEKDSDKQDVYREGWEVISKESTDLIGIQILYFETEMINELKILGRMLSPRLILSGHSHFYCRIRNTLKIEEYTLASFNWR